MAGPSPSESIPARPAAGGRKFGIKAISFALIGLVNTAVDYSVFLVVRALLNSSAMAILLFANLAEFCHCGVSGSATTLVAANIVSWTVAVTGSYVMNSSITFAAESGRKLRWRDYGTFFAAGIVGLVANTATLVFAAEILLLPVWVAKAVAILASFVVNFSFSHFVVFRTARVPGN